MHIWALTTVLLSCLAKSAGRWKYLCKNFHLFLIKHAKDLAIALERVFATQVVDLSRHGVQFFSGQRSERHNHVFCQLALGTHRSARLPDVRQKTALLDRLTHYALHWRGTLCTGIVKEFITGVAVAMSDFRGVTQTMRP